jgi:predicted RNA binding protein YcfA (HicA-like mRNA interferase family)
MRLPQLRAVEILRLLERLGYERVGPPGGHVKMRRKGDANKPEDIVMVPMHKGRDLPRWLTARLLKHVAQANDLTIEELITRYL